VASGACGLGAQTNRFARVLSTPSWTRPRTLAA
jgi:hypothetical protein